MPRLASCFGRSIQYRRIRSVSGRRRTPRAETCTATSKLKKISSPKPATPTRGGGARGWRGDPPPQAKNNTPKNKKKKKHPPKPGPPSQGLGGGVWQNPAIDLAT